MKQSYSRDGTIPTDQDPLLAIGDEFTIHGVEMVDRRSMWRKLVDWLKGTPPPPVGMQRFVITRTAKDKYL